MTLAILGVLACIPLAIQAGFSLAAFALNERVNFYGKGWPLVLWAAWAVAAIALVLHGSFA